MYMSETICVFIDADNTSTKCIEAIMEEIESHGRIISTKVYGDWSDENMKKWVYTANNYGLEKIQCDRISGKNSSDIKLVVDVMHTLFLVTHVSLFYIVTSDSDFRHVFPEIKLLNKKVNCIGSTQSNKSLQSSCDTFTKTEVLTKIYNKKNEKKDFCEINQKVLNTFWNEIEIIMENNNVVNLSAIKDILQRKYQFDQREYGTNTMQDFIKKYYNDKLDIININNCSGKYVKLKD